MRYVPPFGMESTPDAPYVNGDPTIGRQGSIPPANAFEHPMRELVNVIEKSGLVPSSADLTQVAQGVRSQFMNFAEDHGSQNNLIADFDPHITVYTRGLVLRVRVRFENSGGSRIDAGAGWARIIRPDGIDVAPGDLPAGAIANLIYDGSSFQLMNFGAKPADITINTIPIPYTVDISETPNYIDAQFNPPITPAQMVPGLAVFVKVNNTIVASPPNDYPMIRVNSNAPVPVYANGHVGMYANDIARGDVKLFVLSGALGNYPAGFWIDPNYLIRKLGRVAGFVRRDAIGGAQMDGTQNTPQRAFRSISEAYNAIASRYAPSPLLAIDIILGQPATTNNDPSQWYEGAELGPYGGLIQIFGGESASAGGVAHGPERQYYRIGYAGSSWGAAPRTCIEASACDVNLVGVTLQNMWAATAYSHLISRNGAKVGVRGCNFELRTASQNGSFIWAGENGQVSIVPHGVAGVADAAFTSLPSLANIVAGLTAWGQGKIYTNSGMEFVARTRQEWSNLIFLQAGYLASQLSFIHGMYSDIHEGGNSGRRWLVTGNSIIQGGASQTVQWRLPGNQDGAPDNFGGIYMP